MFSLYAHNYLVEQEQRRNMDKQLVHAANTLQHFKWSEDIPVDYTKIEALIYNLLGPDELDKFFIVRTETGKIIFKSKMVNILRLENIQMQSEWMNLIVDTAHIRIYNHRLPQNENKVIQVGLVMNTKKREEFSQSTFAILILAIGGLGLLSSWLLSHTLFLPIRQLARFLAQATHELDRKNTVPNVPPAFYSTLNRKDELRILAQDLDELLNKINHHNRISRLWAAQMTHELKTPLS